MQKDKFKNLSKKEPFYPLYYLKNDNTIVKKGAEKGSRLAWDKEDYLKEVHKQLPLEEVYGQISNDPSNPESTIFTIISKTKLEVTCLLTLRNNFSLTTLCFLGCICYKKFINCYIIFLVDQ